MTRTQTMVQLSEELVASLDAEAARAGQSRSAFIRDVLIAHLKRTSLEEKERRYVEGYRRMPQADFDEFGPFESERHGHEMALRLDAEEEAAGLSW